MKTWILRAALVAALPAAAESFTGGDNANPFQNAVPATSSSPSSGASGSTSGGAKPSDAGFFSSTSNIQDNSAGNASNGREYKLGDAQKQSGAGTGAAIAAGSALTAAGMAEMAKMNFPEAARLLGMAGMEFAQAGADSAAGSQNGQGRQTLLQEGGQTGQQQKFNPQDMAQKLLTPENRQQLQKQGVNPDQFMSNLTSGQIQSGTSALSAMGQDPSSYSPDAQASMNDFSGFDFGNIPGMPEPMGDQNRELLSIKDDAPINPNASQNAAANSGGLMAGSIAGLPSASSATSGSVAAVGTALSPGAGGALVVGKPLAAPGADAARGLASLPMAGFFNGQAVGGGAAEVPPSREQLLALGVTKAKGQNIFRVANRNYYSFAKWRKTKAQQKPHLGKEAVASLRALN